MEERIFDSFELLYLYVENIRCFENQEFVFTTEYNIKYDKETRELKIEERHDKDYLKGFFGPNISNINLIVGKNGSGKSTILDILGNNDLDRDYILNSKNNTNKEQHYFLVYKTNNDYIYIEGFNIIFKKINIFELNNVKVNKTKYFNILYNIKENKVCNKYTSLLRTKTLSRNSEENNVRFYISHDKLKYDIFYIKSIHNRLEITKGLPMLNRIYYDTYNKQDNLSYLYDLLTSNYEYKKLLTSNISFPVININLFDSVVFNKIISKLKINLKHEGLFKVFFLLRILSNFIMEINNVSNTKNILDDLTTTMMTIKKSISIFERNPNLYRLNLEINKLYDTLKRQNSPKKVNIFIKILEYHINEFKILIELIEKDITNNQIDFDFNDYKKNNNEKKYIFMTKLNQVREQLEILKQNYQIIIKIIDSLEISRQTIENYSDLKLIIFKLIKQFENASHYSYDLNSNIIDNFKNLIKSAFFLPKTLITFSYDSLEISIPTKKCFEKKIYNFLLNYDKLNNNLKTSIFKINFQNNISEGELKFLNQLHNLFSILKNSNNSTSLILLDEPDQSFHPEWSEKYISCLISMVNDIAKIREEREGEGVKYQFIISTHSPFMLTDIPKEFITKIDIITDDNGVHNRKVTKAEHSFACNYYDLIKDSFFLEHTMGDFAYNKIKNIQKILTNKKYSKIKIFVELAKELNIDINKKIITCQCFNEIESKLLYFIGIIGEPLIKMQLHNLWNGAKIKWANNTSEFVKTLTKEEKENLYNELYNQLKKYNQK